ncbi:hypothetical protein AAFF_G00108350 [Aldrovandia affinis]|uniref:Uncharacterized protein n=1 Tax=Aldrovandia affinis TaxID=143900 RepID=A0AAD7WAS8_9TELE|nr:hypothetical protein AAFF_G00108350 [Aldrovandia affinis]
MLDRFPPPVKLKGKGWTRSPEPAGPSIALRHCGVCPWRGSGDKAACAGIQESRWKHIPARRGLGEEAKVGRAAQRSGGEGADLIGLRRWSGRRRESGPGHATGGLTTARVTAERPPAERTLCCPGLLTLRHATFSQGSFHSSQLAHCHPFAQQPRGPAPRGPETNTQATRLTQRPRERGPACPFGCSRSVNRDGGGSRINRNGEPRSPPWPPHPPQCTTPPLKAFEPERPPQTNPLTAK